jgi:hypothetical protein
MAPFAQKHVPAHLRPENYTTGRPSLYRDEYCDLVVEKMAEGLSLTAFAGFIRVSVDAVYDWIKVHRDFSDAVSRARPARVLALEQKLLRSRKGAETTAAIFALKNAAPTEWRDLKHTEHSHSLSVELLTDAQLNAIAAGVSPADAGVIEGQFERTSETG